MICLKCNIESATTFNTWKMIKNYKSQCGLLKKKYYWVILMQPINALYILLNYLWMNYLFFILGLPNFLFLLNSLTPVLIIQINFNGILIFWKFKCTFTFELLNLWSLCSNLVLQGTCKTHLKPQLVEEWVFFMLKTTKMNA